jgi:DNA-binding GntR family transcriptional regulator
MPAEALFDMPRLSRSTLNDEVYEQLKEAMILGKIAPGSTMTIRSLADSFGISMMPVREALRRLVAEHVLVLLPNRSVALPIYTPQRFAEITAIRTALEGLAAEEGARWITPDKIEYMARMNAEMENTTGTNSGNGLECNREFHFTLYRSSEMPTLIAMIESLWLQVGPLLNLQQEIFKERRIGVYERHREALDGLRKHEPAEVKAAMVKDIIEAATFISARL